MTIYKVTIDAVDGDRFYIAGSPDVAELLAFLQRYDHEGSSVVLDWMVRVGTDVHNQGIVADPERIERILRGEESPT